jgi:hypothetical protein
MNILEEHPDLVLEALIQSSGGKSRYILKLLGLLS